MLDALAGERLQSDSRHAESYIRSRADRGYGPRRIAAELKVRGTAADQIRCALDAADCDWSALARRADRKKFGVDPGGGFDVMAKRRRYLETRGFAADQIKAVLNASDDFD